MSEKIRSGRKGENTAAIEANWPFPGRRGTGIEPAKCPPDCGCVVHCRREQLAAVQEEEEE